MGDLNVGKIPLGNFVLERLDTHDGKHMKAVESMRDKRAVEMCYDIHCDMEMEKNGTLYGNSFLVSRDDEYVGYMFISDEYERERILAYIVEEKVRGCGLGTVMLTSVSKYLFECCGTNNIKLYINKDNAPGLRLALNCGFEKTGISDGVLCEYNKNSK